MSTQQQKSSLCIGLFGTCGGSLWREPFKVAYTAANIPFFDPQKPDWREEDKQIEADHLEQDSIILFPVLGETYGCGSLGETGFSILQAIQLNARRDVVLYIEPDVTEELKAKSPDAAKESRRSRALVTEHLSRLRLANVYVAESLEHMLTMSCTLYQSQKLRYGLSRYNPHNLYAG